jgi:hypothetical protein
LYCIAVLLLLPQSLCDSDLNPLTRNQLATSLAVTGMKSVVARIAMVGLSTCLEELGKAQFVLMLICVFLVTYFLFKSVSAAVTGIHQQAVRHFISWQQQLGVLHANDQARPETSECVDM